MQNVFVLLIYQDNGIEYRPEIITMVSEWVTNDILNAKSVSVHFTIDFDS